MELEWKICGRKSRWDMVRKWKGNGREMEWIFFDKSSGNKN